jgi:multidrug efflux system membrane fusion protein
MLTGIFKSDSHVNHNSARGELAATARWMLSTATLQQRALTLNATTKASQEVKLVAEVNGTIVAIPAAEGSFLKEGEIIARIEDGGKKALMEQARANYRKAELSYQAARSLYSKKLSSEVGLAAAEVAYKSARAALEQAELDFHRTTITAPFDGHIDTIEVSVGDYVSSMGANTTIGTFIARHPMRVIAYVPEKDMEAMRGVEELKVKFLDNREMAGKLTFLSSVADPKTRSFKLEATLDNHDGSIRSGETVRVLIPTGTLLAHKVPKSALVIDEDGIIGIKILSDNNIVEFLEVEVIREDNRYLWVSSSKEQLRVITGGQGYLKHGQQLSPDQIGTPESTS